MISVLLAIAITIYALFIGYYVLGTDGLLLVSATLMASKEAAR